MSRVSIITIALNNKEGLGKTISSVEAQSSGDFELIVIDGGSTDGTIAEFQSHPAVTVFVSESDQGIYDAQNKGVMRANSPYLLFLNSGDILSDKNVLERAQVHLSGGKALYYGDLLLETKNGIESHHAPAEIDMDFLLNSGFWHPCTFIRRDLFGHFGKYRVDYKIAGDYEFFIRCMMRPGIEAEHLPFFISVFDGEGVSNDPANSALIEKERSDAWKENLNSMVYEDLRQHNAFVRSKYARLYRTMERLRGRK